MNFIDFFGFDVHIVILTNEFQIFYITYLRNRFVNIASASKNELQFFSPMHINFNQFILNNKNFLLHVQPISYADLSC
jgi:hypothetical protein